MKTKHVVIIIANLVLLALLLLFERLQLKDVVFIYLLVFVFVFIFSNIEYLFRRRKHRYGAFIIGKLYVNSIITIFLLGIVLFITRPKYVSKEAAVSDLQYMIKTLENVHPDIYHVYPKDSFVLQLNQEIERLPGRITELEFYKTCARLTSFFRTGHTRPM